MKRTDIQEGQKLQTAPDSGDVDLAANILESR